MSEVLVVTCPTGKQCSHLIPLLYNKDIFHLRLAAHSETSASKLRSQYPNADIVTTDLTELSGCRKLLHGATSVYHVGPSFHSREKEIGFNMIDAAVAETQRPGNVFKHFVFSSVLGTQHRALLQHDLKSYIEERLFLSTLSWTIIKPTNFMDAFPVALLAQQDKPEMRTMWQPQNANSLAALRDLAEASAKILTEREKHYLAEYPFCSTMPISHIEIGEAISRRIGKQVTIATPPFEGGVETVLTYLFGSSAAKTAARLNSDIFTGKAVNSNDAGLAAEGDLRPDLVRDEAERLILFYNRRGLKGSPNVARWLLGREPTSLEEWIDLQMKEAGLP